MDNRENFTEGQGPEVKQAMPEVQNNKNVEPDGYYLNETGKTVLK